MDIFGMIDGERVYIADSSILPEIVMQCLVDCGRTTFSFYKWAEPRATPINEPSDMFERSVTVRMDLEWFVENGRMTSQNALMTDERDSALFAEWIKHQRR